MNRETQNEQKTNKLTEGIDYYFENGFMVLTAHFLKNRGHCCTSSCRHCPYSKAEDEKS